MGPDHVLEQNLSSLRLWLLQGCPKEGALSQSGLSLQFNRPMSVLHGAPVAMFSSQNQPSTRCSPAASPVSPSPPHLQAKPHDGPVAAISKGPVADVALPEGSKHHWPPASLGRGGKNQKLEELERGQLSGRMEDSDSSQTGRVVHLLW